MKKLKIICLLIIILICLSSCSFLSSVFLGKECTISFQIDENLGYIEVSTNKKTQSTSSGSFVFHKGENVTFKAVAKEGASFDRWAKPYSSFSNEITIKISHDTVLNPRFAKVEDPYLVMLYIAEGNTLENEGLKDINSMEEGLYNASAYNSCNMKVVALYDRMHDSSSFAPWSGTRLYELCPDNTEKIASKVIQSASSSRGLWRSGSDDEEHMGNINTLTNFINWANEAYPEYRRHVLILWNHGSGTTSFKSINGDAQSLTSKSICFDDEDKTNGTFGLDGQLYVGEINDALQTVYNEDFKLEVLGMDACYMGMYEIAYEFRDTTNYFASSPAVEYGGWNYNYIFSSRYSLQSPEMFCREIAEGYRDKSNNLGTNNTMTAFNLSKIETLKTQIDELANSIVEFCKESNDEGKEYNSSSKSKIESLRDASIHFYKENSQENTVVVDNESLVYPFFDIGSLCEKLINDTDIPTTIKNKALSVQETLKEAIIWVWFSSCYGQKDGGHLPYGLSIFFSRGNIKYKDSDGDYSHYDYHWYYTDKDTSTFTDENGDTGLYTYGYGKIDAANTDSNSTYTWKEMLDFFYETTE